MTPKVRERCVAWLVLGLLCACGGGSPAPDVQPAPSASPAPTPRPTPGCGNGIVDDGEFCDGEDFCSNCTLAFSDTCCMYAQPDGTTACAESFGGSPHACVDAHATIISAGSSCEGSSCDPATSICLGDGHCATHPIEPTSICCQLDAGGCKATAVSDSAALAESYLLCSAVGLGTPVIGSCGDDGMCARP